VALIPNQQAEDELVSSRYNTHRKPSAPFRRAQWMKNLLEASKPAKLTLFFLTIFATALAISDCILTPPISGTVLSTQCIYSLATISCSSVFLFIYLLLMNVSVLSAVNGLKLRSPHLTTGTNE
jgi:KUP system potassium uptake protein